MDSTSEQNRNISQQYPENETRNQQVLSALLEKFIGKKDQIIVVNSVSFHFFWYFYL